MYTHHIKRTILLFIICLCMLFVCFTMQISATTMVDPGETTPPDTLSTQTSPQQGTTENENQNGKTVTDTNAPEEDSTVSSEAPTIVYIGEPSNAKGNSYTGTNPNPAVSVTSSTVTSYITQDGTSRNSLAIKYAKYFKIGMISFGVIGAACIFFLVFYNIKAYKLKKGQDITKPAKKEKNQKKDKVKDLEEVKPKHLDNE